MRRKWRSESVFACFAVSQSSHLPPPVGSIVGDSVLCFGKQVSGQEIKWFSISVGVGNQ